MNGATPPLIRPLRRDERSDWEPLWQGYLAFHAARALYDKVADRSGFIR